MAPLYAQLLVEAAVRLGPTDAFYSLWPAAMPTAPWAAVFTRLYKEVFLPHPLQTLGNFLASRIIFSAG